MQFNFIASNPSVNNIKNTHDTQKSYICDICDYETPDKKSLVNHKEFCHKPIPELCEKTPQKNDLYDDLSCKQCSYRAIHLNDLNRHTLQMHSSHVPTEIFGCEDRLKRHIQIKHAQQSSRTFYPSSRQNQGKGKSESKSFSEVPLKCNSCDYKTKVIEELRNHKQEHKMKTTEPMRPFPDPSHVSSPPSSDKCRTWSNGNALKCDKCKKSMEHRDEFKLHMEFFHTNVTNQQ